MKKVLVVEDTTEALNALRDLLMIEGYEVISAVNGEDAMHKFYIYTPDIVVTDLRMPKVDGFALLEKIRSSEQLRKIPVIVFSADATPENEERCKEMGAVAFLKKPSSIEALLDCIESNLKN